MATSPMNQPVMRRENLGPSNLREIRRLRSEMAEMKTENESLAASLADLLARVTALELL